MVQRCLPLPSKLRVAPAESENGGGMTEIPKLNTKVGGSGILD